MSFQQTADPAVAFGRGALPRFARFAGAIAGGIVIGALLAGATWAEPAKASNPGASNRGAAATASSGDWVLCRTAAMEIESHISAPKHLLSAVTLTETGRRGPGRKSVQAWPWTINVGGKGFVFPTKEEALQAVRRLMKQGHRSIDVGCMQVNLKYHPRAFTSLEEAFDPVANVSYGADFLARLKRRHGSWQLAVQHYHSYTEEHRERYATRFNTLWAMERRRMAKAGEKAPVENAVLRAALPGSSLLRRLKPVAVLMALGVNVAALGKTATHGDVLKTLSGRYPVIAEGRTQSAALSRPVPVN